ncbi:hypothetical protein [Nocardia paucivorans]|uniref:hypothetical protein n=1 Tax=Nocardia paucivorans TaxID=114259 RepID=UPI0002F6DAD3|nr:hypothetical protein [Nocardia paucivorans]
MAEQHGSLDIAQARVLRAPSYGGILTERQLREPANLTGWKTRQSLARLSYRGLVTTTRAWRVRYQITPLGRKVLAMQPYDFERTEV